MKVIPKLQQGNTIESDNTKVVRPEIHEPIKAKPRQYSIVDLGGEPSNDTRSAAERNRDYWHPIKGAKARFRASMSNETNPLVGIERTILPSAAGAALVTTPAAVVVGALGNMTVDKLTGGWGNWLEDKTGIPSEIGVYTNPGAWYGGAKGYKIGKDKLITKSIKGDADLAWNPINKNHWIFNKEAKTPSNIAMATANRITPFLSKVKKLPLKVAAYKAAKRTNGNASVSLQDIKTMPADYTSSSILGGGNLEGRNLLAKYIFDENPVVKRMFFNKATSNIKPISRNEARRGFSHGDRYEQLYPGVHNRRYEMSAVVPSGRPLKFQEASEFTEYAGKNPIGKIIGKEAEPVMRMGDKEFMTFRQPELVTMAHGGRFDFKKSPLLKKQEEINGKRDMRKKFIKSSRPTYKKRIKKAQQGMKFVSYNPVSNPTIDYTDITNPINPFSEYNYNTTYDKPEALVVPVRDTNETDVVANNPTVEPVINKPVASKVTYTPKSYKGLAAFNKAYDEVEASNPEAKKYRQFLTKMAEQESGFNSAIQNRAGAPAYGYFQFMQDDKKYNNIRQYADTDIETFRNNPKLQIEAAIKLAKSFEKGFSKEDLELANKNGYSTWGLLGGAWLAGNGGVRKFLRGQGNPSDRHWSKEGKGTDVATRIKAFNFKEGGIIKYQEPAQPIKYMGGYDKRGNMVLPVTNENGMNNVTLPEVTVTPRNINLAGAVDRGRREAAPYVSTLLTGAIFGPLSVAGGYAGNEAVNKITNVASNGKYNDWSDMMSKTTGMNPVVADFFNIGNLAGGFGMRNFGPKLKPVKDMAVGGNKWARARVISKAIDKGTPSVEPLPNNVGWGPRQSIHVVHDKNSARLPKLYFPERWDAIHEGAPEVGIWYQGKLGNPRTAANHSIPGKAEKAAKARERFAKRPYRVEGDLELERPIVTVGDVPNRAALERAADKMSADGVIFNNVYDNGYSNNQVIFSLRDDLKNGRVFKKGAKPKVDAYYPSKVYKRTVDDVNRDYLNFIEYIDNSETMQKLADIDKELGTQYVKAVTDFKEAAKQGKLRVKSPKPGTLDIQGYPIRNPQTLTHPDIMKNPNYDYIDIDILADFPPNSVGHEFKHAIENYQAALSGIKGSVDDALFANPRLQALMKDNIVSEDEFVASMVKRYPKNDIKEIRKVYKYLTDPGEFNAQLHPLIELEQRAGKSGLPNFKDADAVNQVIKQGRASGHGGSHLDILFNNLLKPDKREEFVKQFNKYGWSLAAPAIINNRE